MRYFTLPLLLGLAACGTGTSFPGEAELRAESPSGLRQARVVDIDFNDGAQGFVAGFADYPKGEERFYELASGLRSLPAPLDTTRQGFMLSGNNHSDDLLMFLQGPVGDLAEGGSYHASLCVEFASAAPLGSVGVGGSPAESVYVKLGWVAQQAAVNTRSGYQRITIDVGSQGQGGRDAEVVGNVGVEDDGTGWHIKKLCTDNARLHVTTVADHAWAFVGFDSGFEATSTVYVTRLTLTLQ